ncbi:plasma membrane iron permease [Kickxella alabastrina]|uniref:plasma membrane iron permease n=1 Tax=Kickxella alabastrina TaxID=61397 RepID=UPI00221EAE4B|nr:plasma membrane iron permease [Kickxella alabastrina]KAI7820349.1 plasma membrane iron permease [Kickxella alabastrina]KAJ1943274.1 high-affinity iron permease [Kickxella alabastrina]
MANVFNVAIFFIIFRETIEAGMIISVLLSFSKQMFETQPEAYKRARKHIWIGAAVGFLICLIIGAVFIGVFYTVANDLWQKTEALWEGIFCLIATIMITVMGLGMLRSGRMQEKWRGKLSTLMDKQSEKTGWRKWFDIKIFSKKYLFFHLPFLTVLREGLEAVVFVGGVSLGATAKSIPLPVIIGLICGAIVGFAIYRTGNAMSFHWYFVVSTCLLYLIAAGLMSKSVWFFEEHTFSKYAGADPDASGVIDVRVNVWALDYGNPEANDDTAWGVFNAILGWNNVATYGTIISYCLYWVFLAAFLLFIGIREKRVDRLKASIDHDEKNMVSSHDNGSDKLQPTIEVR